jgi:hypothetical protein
MLSIKNKFCCLQMLLLASTHVNKGIYIMNKMMQQGEWISYCVYAADKIKRVMLSKSFRGTLTSLDGFMIGSPSSESFLVPQLSNQESSTHSASMCMTEDCVTMFSILSPPTSTTGKLFILYLDRSNNMVRNVPVVSSARNGAHRKLPEISRTYKSTTR